jgi:pyruvyltransferase
MVALKYWTDESNAGDLFSRNVTERYIGPVTAKATGDRFGSLNLLVVGSLMLWCDRDTVVCGAGMIAPQFGPREAPRKIIAVRGPRTRAELLSLGVPTPARYGDPGVLAAEFATPGVKQTHAYGVLLHHVDQRWSRHFGRGWLRGRRDTLFIDVRQDPLAVIDAIQQCGVILSSSLHGLIFAHALGKKAMWVKCGPLVGDTFKFYDYFDSIGVDEASVQVEQIAGRADIPRLAARAQAFDVSALAAKVRENLEETHAWLLSASLRQAS